MPGNLLFVMATSVVGPVGLSFMPWSDSLSGLRACLGVAGRRKVDVGAWWIVYKSVLQNFSFADCGQKKVLPVRKWHGPRIISMPSL